MAYTLTFGLTLGPGQAGLSLEYLLVDTAGAAVGSASSAGIVEIGLGNYLATVATIPPGHRGGILFRLAGGGALKAVAAVNPEEAEYLDAHISDAASLAALAASNADLASSKLGGFSGTIPANDVFGFLRAIMRKDATLPSDVGGTYTPAADSLEALRERGDAAYGRRIAKNTALANFEFPMVLSSDHVSAATGLTVTAQRSLDGGAFANCANAVAEIANGFYKINLASSDLNGDVIALRFTAAGADPTVLTIVTQPD